MLFKTTKIADGLRDIDTTKIAQQSLAKLAEVFQLAEQQLQKLQTMHRYSRKILTSKRCDHCQKAVLFVGLRCKDCRFKCHRKCAKVSQHRCQHVVDILQATSQSAARASDRLRPWHRLSSQDKTNRGWNTKQSDMPGSATEQTFGEFETEQYLHGSACSGEDSTDNAYDEVFVDSGIHTPLNLTSVTEDRVSRSSYSSSYCSFVHSSSVSISTPQRTFVPAVSPTTAGAPPCFVISPVEHDHMGLCFQLPPAQQHSTPVDASTRRRNLSATLSCPSKEKQSSKLHLCSTWPTFNQADLEEECDSNPYNWQQELDRENLQSGDRESIRNKLQEWKINYDDLEFGQCMRKGKDAMIYRGRWHGDVVIHTYAAKTDVGKFLEEVGVLSRIRHENIELFMGVCLDPPRLAVVTSVHKGPSLFEHVHLKGEVMSMRSKINVAIQIAQGIGYLHAMGVVVGSKLNSRNIFMENKVKLCLLGFDIVEQQAERDDTVCLPQGHLTYMAPELLRTMQIEDSELYNETFYSTHTDSYSYGTVMYELISGNRPFQGEHPHSMIWKICNGEVQSLSQVDCPVNIKSLINDCWSDEPLDRPSFTDIAKELRHNVSLHKKHSQSNPERLNRLGRPMISSPLHLRSQWT